MRMPIVSVGDWKKDHPALMGWFVYQPPPVDIGGKMLGAIILFGNRRGGIPASSIRKGRCYDDSREPRESSVLDLL
jgi:hypothetical protein